MTPNKLVYVLIILMQNINYNHNKMTCQSSNTTCINTKTWTGFTATFDPTAKDYRCTRVKPGNIGCSTVLLPKIFYIEVSFPLDLAYYFYYQNEEGGKGSLAAYITEKYVQDKFNNGPSATFIIIDNVKRMVVNFSKNNLPFSRGYEGTYVITVSSKVGEPDQITVTYSSKIGISVSF